MIQRIDMGSLVLWFQRLVTKWPLTIDLSAQVFVKKRACNAYMYLALRRAKHTAEGSGVQGHKIFTVSHIENWIHRSWSCAVSEPLESNGIK